jgi:formate dehydrogenase gamma subunit
MVDATKFIQSSRKVKEDPGMSELLSIPPSETPANEQQPSPLPDSKRAQQLRKVLSLVGRVRTLPSGEHVVIRFRQVEIFEHWVLLASYIMLALTGLLEVAALTNYAADVIKQIFGNLDNVRSLHSQAAIIYTGLVIFHFARVLVIWFIKRPAALMLPSAGDFGDFVAAWKHLLSNNAPRPAFGRFTIGQKLTYWVVTIFSAVMILTGLVMFFQTPLAQFLPEFIQPILRALHNGFGVFSLAAFLPWHVYLTLVRERNFSIFTGEMHDGVLRRNHAIEYSELVSALEAYRTLKAQPTPKEDTPTPLEKSESA